MSHPSVSTVHHKSDSRNSWLTVFCVFCSLVVALVLLFLSVPVIKLVLSKDSPSYVVSASSGNNPPIYSILSDSVRNGK